MGGDVDEIAAIKDLWKESDWKETDLWIGLLIHVLFPLLRAIGRSGDGLGDGTWEIGDVVPASKFTWLVGRGQNELQCGE